MDVGSIKSLAIDGDHVVMGFSLGGNQIGTDSRLAIRTDTILGKKVLEVQPEGSRSCGPTGYCRWGRAPRRIRSTTRSSTSPRRPRAGISRPSRSLNVLSDTINQTYPNLSAALDGVARFSDTIGKRDEQFKQLLANANKIAAVLGDRSGQINPLLVNAKTLLAAVNARGQAIDYLLANVQQVSTQFQGLVNDNPNLNHVLEQLRTVTDLLVKHKFDLADVLVTLSKFTASLAEAVGSGPYFKVLLVNLLPGSGTAAVHRRGVQEARYRPGAVLAQRGPAGVPIPRPQRSAPAQWCAAAGADGAGGHAGSSRPRGAPGFAVLVHPAGRRHAVARQPAALRGPDGRAVRRQPIRTELRWGARCSDVGAQPERGSAGARPTRRRRTRPGRRPPCRAPRCRSHPGRRVRARSRSGRCPAPPRLRCRCLRCPRRDRRPPDRVSNCRRSPPIRCPVTRRSSCRRADTGGS